MSNRVKLYIFLVNPEINIMPNVIINAMLPIYFLLFLNYTTYVCFNINSLFFRFVVAVVIMVKMIIVNLLPLSDQSCVTMGF